MSAHDRHLAGHSSFPVDITCRSCDHSFDGTETSEYGAGWLENARNAARPSSTPPR